MTTWETAVTYSVLPAALSLAEVAMPKEDEMDGILAEDALADPSPRMKAGVLWKKLGL